MSNFTLSDSAITFYTLASLSVTKYIIGAVLRWNKTISFVKVGHVSSLIYYPVKSCGGISLYSGECTKLGVKGEKGITDRHWLVVKQNGDFITQRHEPKMALIQVICHGDELHIIAPGMPVLKVTENTSCKRSQVINCRVWDDTTVGLDCGQEASDWLSKFLGITGLQLLYSAPGLNKRDISKGEKPWGNPALPGDQVAYGDFGAYLVATTSSLEMLNSKLRVPVPMTNFRPNIVIQSDLPFDEDNWSEIRIGENIEMRMLDGCTRCQMTTIISSLGQKNEDGEPLKTLKTFRCFKKYGSSPIFGVNATVDIPGYVRVGDPVYAYRKSKLDINSSVTY